jgi:hypothetical protein
MWLYRPLDDLVSQMELNPFRGRQSEAFIRHAVDEEPSPWDFAEGARGVQLPEAAHRAWEEGRRVALEELEE